MRFYRIKFNDGNVTRQTWATSRKEVKTIRDQLRREFRWRMAFEVDRIDVAKKKWEVLDFLNKYAGRY
jgi:hypothetical protein